MSNLNQTIETMLGIEGALGAAILDVESGMTLAKGGHGPFDMELTAASTIDVIRAYNRGSEQAGRVGNDVQEITAMYPTTMAFVRVLDGANIGLAMLLILERATGNQALANHKLARLQESLEV